MPNDGDPADDLNVGGDRYRHRVAKPWTDEIVQAADIVVTMGCGDSCAVFPGKRYEDWDLADPAGQDVEAVRPIRDDIEHRVRTLLASLEVAIAG
jgi:protein-tyrosine-phosphatase